MSITETTPILEKLRRSNEIYEDVDPSQFTFGRRIAQYLSQYEWYNPHIKAEPGTKPNLDSAWAYFEHVTLARYYEPIPGNVCRAPQGEAQMSTKLYPYFKTTEEDLGGFGVGCAVYFMKLRTLAFIMFIAGLINIPNFRFFLNEYNVANEGIKAFSLQASAICTDKSWAACPTCKRSDWDPFPEVYTNFAQTTADDGTNFSFILVNNCEVNSTVGLVTLVSLIFVCASIVILQKMVRNKIIAYDDRDTTSTDFSIQVTNPPDDADDPEEWKQFFEQFGDVACVTIALNNEELLQALIERRNLILQLSSLMPSGADVDPKDIDPAIQKALPLRWYQKLMFASDAQTLQKQIQKIDMKIENDLSKRNYSVCKVFVVFEYEAYQQKALEALCVGGWAILRNNTSMMKPKHLFRGQCKSTRLLAVSIPPEPLCVCWEKLQVGALGRGMKRLLTFSLTALTIILSCITVTAVRERYGLTIMALSITAINSVAPTICDYLVIFLEAHTTRGTQQASIYFKTTACKWVLTTILTAYVTPFVNTLDNDDDSLIPALYAIYIAELVVTPVTKTLDIVGHLYRHVLAPRCENQKIMNAFFEAEEFDLSERYTDMSNVLFLTCFYSAIMPAGYFWSAATLMVHYYVDKFCLLRVWTPAPNVDTPVVDLSRLYIFPLCIMLYAIMSSYSFALFPFDNSCELPDEELPHEYVGSFNATTGEGESVVFSIEDGSSVFKYCNQDMLRYNPWPAFPAIPSSQPKGNEWMNEDQQFSVILGWTAVWVVGFAVLVLLDVVRKRLRQFFFGEFEKHQKLSYEAFSHRPTISAYVPQIKIPGALFPTLLCDVSNIDHSIIGWDDPCDFDKISHNAIYDVPNLVNCGVLSTVTHWGNRWKFFQGLYCRRSNHSLRSVIKHDEHDPLWSFLTLN